MTVLYPVYGRSVTLLFNGMTIIEPERMFHYIYGQNVKSVALCYLV